MKYHFFESFKFLYYLTLKYLFISNITLSYSLSNLKKRDVHGLTVQVHLYLPRLFCETESVFAGKLSRELLSGGIRLGPM